MYKCVLPSADTPVSLFRIIHYSLYIIHYTLYIIHYSVLSQEFENERILPSTWVKRIPEWKQLCCL